MPVGRPRVGAAQAVDEILATRVGERPQTERTVDVEPTVPRGDPVGDLRERVERTGVHLAGLRAHQHGNAVRHIGRKVVGAHPALVVGGHDRHTVASRGRPARVTCARCCGPFTDHHMDLRGAEQSVALHVPSVFVEQGVAGGREAPGVRDRRSGHERNIAVAVEPEHVEHPRRATS